MRKLLFTLAAILTLTACEKEIVQDGEGTISTDCVMTKKFTFTMKGEFGGATFTRGYLDAEDNVLTDLWVFDFVNNECVQSLHQTNTDSDWGKPQMNLTYGSHHIYFVASRGADPNLDNASKTITWGAVRDTFWKDYAVNVVSTSNGNRAVTMERVVTKLKITVTDEVPTGTSSISLTPSIWYLGLNYTTGEPTHQASNQSRVISVPSSYIGTSGVLSASIFGFSSSTEWTTDIAIIAKDNKDNIIGFADIFAAPFLRNRATEFSGTLFCSNSLFSLDVNDSWDDSYNGNW